MTETEQKARALVNEVREERLIPPLDHISREFDSDREALCRAIERHEAFRQEMSDAVEAVIKAVDYSPTAQMTVNHGISRFIIAKPDPLVELLNDLYPETSGNREYADTLRAALAARGLDVRKIGEGEAQATTEAEPQEIKLSSFERKFL